MPPIIPLPFLRKSRSLALGIPLHIRLRILIKLRPIRPILVGDPSLQRIIRLRLSKQVPHGLQHRRQPRRRLPRIGLQDGQADVAEAVVGDVGVVDARGELGHGRLEGVVGGEVEEHAEGAAGVGGGGGPGYGYLPAVDVGVGAEGDGHAGGGGLHALAEFLVMGRAVRSVRCTFVSYGGVMVGVVGVPYLLDAFG